MSMMGHHGVSPTALRVTVQGSSRDFLDSVVTIGRDAHAPISLPHPDVSRRHAEFRRTPQGWVLVDLGSTNGTFIGPRALTQEVISPDHPVIVTVGGQGGPSITVEIVADSSGSVPQPQSQAPAQAPSSGVPLAEMPPPVGPPVSAPAQWVSSPAPADRKSTRLNYSHYCAARMP